MELLYPVLFVCYACYTFNRKIVVFSMPKMIEEGMDARYVGLIISCQNLAFTIIKFPIGVVSDHLNPYMLLAVGLFLSGITALTFSFSSSMTALCCLWFLNGLAQGCGWPACAKILRQRASPSQFGTLWSILSSGYNFSGSIGPYISTLIIVYFGWRWNIFTAGLLTVVFCVIFLLSMLLITDTSSRKNEKKSPDIKDGQATMAELFQDPFILLLCVNVFIIFCARTTTTDWGPIYLIEEMKQSQFVASAFQSSVETGGFIGKLVGGFVTDWIIKRCIANPRKELSQRVQLRMKTAILFITGNVVFVYLFRFTVYETSSFIWITFVGTMMGMTYYGPQAILSIIASESVPSHLSGSSSAIVSLCGNIGSTLSGLPFSYIAKFYQWSTVFLMLEIMMAGSLLALVRWRKLTFKSGKPKQI